MSDREKCVQLLNDLPETRIPGVLQLINAFNNALNRAETLEAIQESEAMLQNPNAKRYTDLNELWKDLDTDEV